MHRGQHAESQLNSFFVLRPRQFLNTYRTNVRECLLPSFPIGLFLGGRIIRSPTAAAQLTANHRVLAAFSMHGSKTGKI